MSSSKKYAFSASFGIYFFSISQSNDVEFFNKYAMKENNPIQDSKSQEKLTSDVVLVRNLVETLKEKLGIPDSMEDIVRTYCDVNAALPRSSEDKPVSRDIPFWLRNLPERFISPGRMSWPVCISGRLMYVSGKKPVRTVANLSLRCISHPLSGLGPKSADGPDV